MTVTKEETGVDNDLLDALDFEESKMCESNRDCGQEASYIFISLCCGVTFLICEDCLFGYFEQMKKWSDVVMRCVKCNTRYLMGEHKYKVVPLRT